MRLVLTLVCLSMPYAIGCSGKPKALDMGGEDGSQVASLVEDLNEVKHNPKKLAECFASKQGTPDSKKLNKMAFYIVGKPTINGSSATCKVLAEDAMSGNSLGEQEWTFEKVGEGWKIKTAPIP